MSIQAIQTHYDGYHFRSRLEARWAVFFNTANKPYSDEQPPPQPKHSKTLAYSYQTYHAGNQSSPLTYSNGKPHETRWSGLHQVAAS